MTTVGTPTRASTVSEQSESVEVVETPADYRSARALRHEDGYFEWKRESEEKRDELQY